MAPFYGEGMLFVVSLVALQAKLVGLFCEDVRYSAVKASTTQGALQMTGADGLEDLGQSEINQRVSCPSPKCLVYFRSYNKLF